MTRKTWLGLTFAGLLVLASFMPGAAQPVQYAHAWGTDKWEAATAVEVDVHGNVYLVGPQLDPNSGVYRGFVAKLSPRGEILWDRLLELPDAAYVVDIARLESGDLVLVGFTFREFPYTNSTTFVARMSPEGDLRFARVIPNLGIPSGFALTPASDGFVVVGQELYAGAAFVAAFDESGVPRWSRRANLSVAYTSAVVVDASGITHVGLTTTAPGIRVASFSPDGTLGLQRELVFPGGGAWLTGMRMTASESLALIGLVASSGGYDTDVFLGAFDRELHPDWVTAVRSPSLSEASARLAVMPDGSFYALGPGYSAPDYYPGSVLYRFGASGSFLEASLYAGSASTMYSQILDLQPTHDGGLAMAGLTIGVPPLDPTPMTDATAFSLNVTTRDVDGVWTSVDVGWSDVGVRLTDPEAYVDDFRVSAMYQAWVGFVLRPESAVSVDVGYYQTDLRNATIEFSSIVSGGAPPYEYRWSFGDGYFARDPNPVHVYSQGGRYLAQLAVQDADGAVGYGRVEFLIQGPPIVTQVSYSPRPAEVGDSVFLSAVAMDPDGGSILQYRWDYGDGSSQTTAGASTSHRYYTTGNFTVTVAATDDEGDTGTGSVVVEVLESVNDPPHACMSFDPFAPAVNTDVRFSGSCSFDPDGYITSWSWDFGDGATATGVYAIHRYTAPGYYLVTLTVTDNEGASDSTSTFLLVQENVAPIASFWFEPERPNAGEAVHFNGWNSSDPDGWITEWRWLFVEEGNDTGNVMLYGPEVWFPFSRGGDHIVTLTVADNLGGEGNASQVVHVNEPPVPVIRASSDAAKVGTPITFDGSGSFDPDGSVVDYLWSFGDGSEGSGAAVAHTYGETGSYRVELLIKDDLGSWAYAATTIPVLEPKPPVAIVGWSPSRPSVGQTVTFDGTYSVDPDGSISTYIWQFGDGAVGRGAIVDHVYGYAGTYTVKLTVIDEDGLVDEDSWTVTVASKPRAEFGHSPQSPVVRQPVTFTAAGSDDETGIVDYAWSFGDGTYGNGWQVSHAFGTAGTYAVTLTVTNRLGVRSEVSHEVKIASSVGGRVVTATLQPIAGARVAIYEGGSLRFETTTDANGVFELGNLPAGAYDVEIVREGYSPVRKTFAWDGEGTDLGIWILTPRTEEPRVLSLPDAVVVGGIAAGLAGLILTLGLRWRGSRRPARDRS